MFCKQDRLPLVLLSSGPLFFNTDQGDIVMSRRTGFLPYSARLPKAWHLTRSSRTRITQVDSHAMCLFSVSLKTVYFREQRRGSMNVSHYIYVIYNNDSFWLFPDAGDTVYNIEAIYNDCERNIFYSLFCQYLICFERNRVRCARERVCVKGEV